MQFKACASRYLAMEVGEIEELVSKKTCKALDAVVGTMILKAIEFGDGHRLEMLLTRILGRVKDMETDETDDGQPLVRIIKTDGSVMEIVRPKQAKDGDVDVNDGGPSPDDQEPPQA